MNSLAIDIGGTFIKYGLINQQNQIIKQWKKESKIFEDYVSFYDYLCADIENEKFDIIGVSAPGVISEDSTVLSKASKNVRVMYATNVNAEIGNRLHCPVHTLNDGKSAGYCEFKIGNGKGSSSSVYFLIGTGIGGCLCDDKGIIAGTAKVAGEFSSLPFGPYLENTRMTRLMDVASMKALVKMYNKKAKQSAVYGEEIIRKYHSGDSFAKEVVDLWIRNIAIGISTIIIIYNPEIICIGGGISEEDWFITKINQAIEEIDVIPGTNVGTTILRCKYNNNSNLIGAVLFARDVLSK